MNALGPGQIIAGKFRLRSLLGKGGMGSVWLAEHLSLGSEVAIKFIDPAIADKPSSLRRFKHEAEAAARLRSAHVVQVLDYGLDDDLPYLVMEHLIGESLRQRLDREGPLSANETMRIVAQICKALDKAHEQGVVHRDIKPDNIFVTQEGGETFVKVLDFGIAKAAPVETHSQPEHNTATGTLLGSPQYMSPEQAHGAKEVDRRSDLWSLAVVVFECITGSLPFGGSGWGELVLKICRDPIPKPSERAPVPEGFDTWFERAAERDVEQRIGSAQLFAQELASVLTPGQSAPPLTPNALSTPPRATPEEAPSNDLTAETIPPDSDGLGMAPTLASTTAGFSATDPPKVSKTRGGLALALVVLALGGAFAWWSLFASNGQDLHEPRQTVGSTQRPTTPKPAEQKVSDPETKDREAPSPESPRPEPTVIGDVNPEGTPPAEQPTPAPELAPDSESASAPSSPATAKQTPPTSAATPDTVAPQPSPETKKPPAPSRPKPKATTPQASTPTPPPSSGVLDRRH